MNIYLELGKKKTFACAVDWLGWCRSGKSEDDALQSLFDYANRYADICARTGIDFEIPTSINDFQITARSDGNSTTDFGAPGIIPECDQRKINEDERVRYEKLLRASWDALDEAIARAEGKELRKGPRGGGRELEKIIAHVREADIEYLRKQGQKIPKDQCEDMHAIRIAILETLSFAVKGEIPEKGPRGGAMWSTPYFVRRTLWHTLDHIWEIEDRILP